MVLPLGLNGCAYNYDTYSYLPYDSHRLESLEGFTGQVKSLTLRTMINPDGKLSILASHPFLSNLRFLNRNVQSLTQASFSYFISRHKSPEDTLIIQRTAYTSQPCNQTHASGNLNAFLVYFPSQIRIGPRKSYQYLNCYNVRAALS